MGMAQFRLGCWLRWQRRALGHRRLVDDRCGGSAAEGARVERDGPRSAHQEGAEQSAAGDRRCGHRNLREVSEAAFGRERRAARSEVVSRSTAAAGGTALALAALVTLAACSG